MTTAAYNLARKRIRNAKTSCERRNAQAAGIAELVYQYNTTEYKYRATREEIRQLICELNHLDGIPRIGSLYVQKFTLGAEPPKKLKVTIDVHGGE